MKRDLVALSTVAALLAALGIMTQALAKKVYPEDKGPKTINVSKYPKEMQLYYKLFAKKCSKCHTLARPINSKKATEKEWKPYLDKMRKKPNAGISAAEAQRILKFLVYDGSVRKKKKKTASTK